MRLYSDTNRVLKPENLRDWGLSTEEQNAAVGPLLVSFARCLPQIGPRSQTDLLLANLLQRSPAWQHEPSDNQRDRIWEPCRLFLEAAYLPDNPDSL